MAAAAIGALGGGVGGGGAHGGAAGAGGARAAMRASRSLSPNSRRVRERSSSELSRARLDPRVSRCDAFEQTEPWSPRGSTRGGTFSPTHEHLPGTDIVERKPMLGAAAALVELWERSDTSTPTLAVGIGRHVFVYRQLRPYFKFALPEEPLADAEREAWEGFVGGSRAVVASDPTVAELRRKLGQARAAGARLSLAGAALTSAETDEAIEAAFAEHVKPILAQGASLERPATECVTQPTVVTCLATMRKVPESVARVQYLLIGTESGKVHIFDAGCSTIMRTIELPSPPVKMISTGVFSVDYRLLVLCRDGRIRVVKNGAVVPESIEAETLITDMALADPEDGFGLESDVVVSTMDNRLVGYHIRTRRKRWSQDVGEAITLVHSMPVTGVHSINMSLVGLESGRVLVFLGKHKVDEFHLDAAVTAAMFGSFARETNTLALTSRSGSLTVKMLRRGTDWTQYLPETITPVEQDIPLAVPKRTALYIEQADRERDLGPAMHRCFQRDLCRLRLSAARAFVKLVAGDGSIPSGSVLGTVRVNASVEGLGPAFRIHVTMENRGATSLDDLQLVLVASPALFVADETTQRVPSLVPMVALTVEVRLRCTDPMAESPSVSLLLQQRSSSRALASAVVRLPTSAPELL